MYLNDTIFFNEYVQIEVNCDAGAPVCECKHLSWVQSPLEEMKYLFKFILSFLHCRCTTQRAMPPEFGEK